MLSSEHRHLSKNLMCDTLNIHLLRNAGDDLNPLAPILGRWLTRVLSAQEVGFLDFSEKVQPVTLDGTL